jgi:hypothetical protein
MSEHIAKKNHIHNDVIQEIEILTNLITEQNYFEIDSKFYHQSEGLAVGVPSSALLAEIYLQFLEHYQILRLLLKHKILSFHRYVEDILIIYDTTSTNINYTLFMSEAQCVTAVNFFSENDCYCKDHDVNS